MTPINERVAARCEDCHKVYRVPDPDRVYVCKSCGGKVRVSVEDAQEELAAGGLVLCSDCQTLNPPQAETCRECDADLSEAELVESEEQAADLLAQAKQAFKRATPRGRVIAWTYHLGAFAYGLAAFFAVLALRHPEVPIEGGVLVVVLTTLVSILMGTAALHLLFHPFRWTLAVAVLATLVACVHAIGPNPYGYALMGSAAWALLSWGLLVPAKRFHSLIVHHKDLYILHHASQETKRSLKGRSPGERHERLMRAMRRADRKAWKVSVAAAVILVGAIATGTSLALDGGRPQDFEAALDEFEATWNGGRAEDLTPLYDQRTSELQNVWVCAVTAGHGWSDALPNLPQGTRLEETGLVTIEYQVQGIPLTVSFLLKDLRWLLSEVLLPYPSIEPSLERFRSAWHAADPKGLASFFAPESRAARQEKLEESKVLRGWAVFPSITSTKLEPDGDRGFVAIMYLERGKVISKWFFRDDGAWGLYSLEMPKLPRETSQGNSSSD